MSALARLATLGQAGALASIDVHFARAVARWGGEDEAVVLAAALVSHLAGKGHVCADLAALAALPVSFDPAWKAPALARWRAALMAHPACAAVDEGTAVAADEMRPLRLDGHRLYLARHWIEEVQLASGLSAALVSSAISPPAGLESALDTLFGQESANVAAPAHGQRLAAARAVSSPVALISGGPGTGKTTTLAALLALSVARYRQLHGRAPRILLTAPTGKAAARMQEAVQSAKARLPLTAEDSAAIPGEARTLHRLLGVRPGGGTRYHEKNPLPGELVVVDEASMVDLSLMARLQRALAPGARLVLLGDRDQLASVEAGAVFADLCLSAEAGGPLQAGYAQLHHSFRFGAEAGIGRLARGLREGNGEACLALLRRGAEGLHWEPAPVMAGVVHDALRGYGAFLAAVAQGGDAATLHRTFAQFRLLVAHREGAWGVRRLNAAVEEALGVAHRQPWYAGRPVMVTANDYSLGLYNGDIGIAARDGATGDIRVWFQEGEGYRAVAPSRLPPHETAWAMTVHKSQGSEFDAVLLALPDRPSPLVSRELVYTGVTRGKTEVALWATPAVLLDACQRRIERYSGLTERLCGPNAL